MSWIDLIKVIVCPTKLLHSHSHTFSCKQVEVGMERTISGFLHMKMTLKASREKLCCTFAVQHKINTHNPPSTKVSSLLHNTKEAVGYDPNRGAAMSLPPQQGQQSDLGFTCTWSGWPLEPSGAFAC